MLNKTINFIPTDMAIPVKSVKFAKLLNKLSIVGVLLLILSVISAIVLFIFFSSDLKKTNAAVIALKNEISSLEKSEQKLILVKDKLDKISFVKSLSSAENDINQFKSINDIVLSASNSSLTEISIGSSKTEISFSTPDSSSLALILGSFTNLKDYAKITLSSLGFNSQSGFLSSLIFESK